jgi:hypothetical protein
MIVRRGKGRLECVEGGRRQGKFGMRMKSKSKNRIRSTIKMLMNYPRKVSSRNDEGLT